MAVTWQLQIRYTSGTRRLHVSYMSFNLIYRPFPRRSRRGFRRANSPPPMTADWSTDHTSVTCQLHVNYNYYFVSSPTPMRADWSTDHTSVTCRLHVNYTSPCQPPKRADRPVTCRLHISYRPYPCTAKESRLVYQARPNSKRAF